MKRNYRYANCEKNEDKTLIYCCNFHVRVRTASGPHRVNCLLNK